LVKWLATGARLGSLGFELSGKADSFSRTATVRPKGWKLSWPSLKYPVKVVIVREAVEQRAALRMLVQRAG